MSAETPPDHITPETLAALEAAEPHEAVSASTMSTMSMSEGTLAAFVYRAMVRTGRIRPSDLETSHG